MSGPLRLLAWRELRELVSTSWFIGPALIALLLTPFTVYVGLLDYRARELDHREYVRGVQEARQDGRRTLVGNQPEPALRVVRPPAPASAVVRGLDDATAPYWDPTPAGARAAPGTRGTASVFESSATFDLEFLLRTVIGLIAVTLGASSIARDQRRGTLKMLIATPVTPRRIIAGRMAGGAMLLALLIVLVLAAAAATLLVFEPVLATPEAVAMLVAVAGLTFLYACVLFAAGLVIAEVTRSEATAVAGALVVWLVLSLVLVPGAAFIGRAVVTVPSRTLFEARRDETQRKLALATRELLGDQLRQMIGPDRNPDQVSFTGDLRSALETSADAEAAAARRTLDDMDEHADRAVARQQRVIDLLAGLSPGALFLDAVANIASTGSVSVARWREAVERYQDALQPALFDRPARLYLIVPSRKGPVVMFFDRRLPPAVEELPAFALPDEPLAARLPSASRSTLVLLLYLLLAGAAAMALFRYRPGGEPPRGSRR